MFRAVPERERPRHDRARAELAHAIGRTPYDEREVREKPRAWQAHRQAVADPFAGTPPTAAGGLSPEGRTRLADVARPPPRR